MKFLKMADGQMLSFKKEIHRSKAGEEDLGLTSTGNDSTVFWEFLESHNGAK